MHVIAGASPDNTPSGYYWTFLFPMLLFIVIALILWALFGRPHHRVPAQRITLALGSRRAAADTAGYVGVAAAATTAEAPVAGGAGTASAPEAASGEPAASAGPDEADGAQPSADGAGAGE